MGLEFKVNLVSLFEIPEKIKKNFSREAKDEMEVELLAQIMQGKSPVRGAKWKNYSTSYAAKKGYSSPVNMVGMNRKGRKGGKMLKSFSVTEPKGTSGVLRFRFTDIVAKYHNDDGPSGNKEKIRRLLPTKRGEKFNLYLTKVFTKILKKVIAQQSKRK